MSDENKQEAEVNTAPAPTPPSTQPEAEDTAAPIYPPLPQQPPPQQPFPQEPLPQEPLPQEPLPQQPLPEQPPPQPAQPVTVVTIPAPETFVSRSPQNIVCSSCHAEVTTTVEYDTGIATWICCCILFFITGICCFIPFLIDSTKDAVHKCSSCKALIGRKDVLDLKF